MSEVKKEKAKLKLSFKLVNEYEVAVLGLWFKTKKKSLRSDRIKFCGAFILQM